MKRLTNVSPFLLLLVPVLVMMILAFTINNVTDVHHEEAALKSAPAPKSINIKINTPF